MSTKSVEDKSQEIVLSIRDTLTLGLFATTAKIKQIIFVQNESRRLAAAFCLQFGFYAKNPKRPHNVNLENK